MRREQFACVMEVDLKDCGNIEQSILDEKAAGKRVGSRKEEVANA